MKTHLKFSLITAMAIAGVVPNSAFSADTYDIKYESGKVVVYKQSYANNPIIPNGNYFMPADYFVYGDQAYYADNIVNVNMGSATLTRIYAGYDNGTSGQGSSKNTLNFNSGNVTEVIVGGLAEKNAANLNKV
ncbi:MAG: hypothetical protein IKR42_05150, partial [Campylobacter sp.]|nr:hypothetical protein [Campylobacter sp.]